MSSSKKIKFNFGTMRWEGITVEQVKIWESLYPNVNVVNEITMEMPRWLDKVKGTKKANKRAWHRFICNWLRRASEEGINV